MDYSTLRSVGPPQCPRRLHTRATSALHSGPANAPRYPSHPLRASYPNADIDLKNPINVLACGLDGMSRARGPDALCQPSPNANPVAKLRTRRPSRRLHLGIEWTSRPPSGAPDAGLNQQRRQLCPLKQTMLQKIGPSCRRLAKIPVAPPRVLRRKVSKGSKAG